jgi:predicted kinase
MTQGAGCLIVLVGIPGSGKSEWSRRNADGTVVVSQDDLIDAITPGGFDPRYRAIYRAAEDAVAVAGLEAGLPVIVDRTNRTRALRERWIELAGRQGCPAVAVAMTSDAELCRARNRARTNHRKVAEIRLERMLQVLEAPSQDEGFAAVLDDRECSLESILQCLNLDLTGGCVREIAEPGRK